MAGGGRGVQKQTHSLPTLCKITHELKKIRTNSTFLHWEDTSLYTEEEIRKLNKKDCFWRTVELEELLAERFQKHYVCGQYIDGDEQGILAKCYHSAIQYNGDKPYKYVFKLYCFNDSQSKYMHNCYLFRGKDSDKLSAMGFRHQHCQLSS